jgi:hypothetical protein
MNRLFLLATLCLCGLCGCNQKSPEYFQERGRSISVALVIELEAIDDLDSLLERLAYIESLFDALVDVMIEARKWQQRHECTFEISEEDSQLSNRISTELNRLFQIPLAGHFIEKSQQKALERLDAFEKKSGLQ